MLHPRKSNYALQMQSKQNSSFSLDINGSAEHASVCLSQYVKLIKRSEQILTIENTWNNAVFEKIINISRPNAAIWRPIPEDLIIDNKLK